MVKIEPVDPRDVRWEQPSPAYRVYFWRRPPAPPGVLDEHVGWHCDERRITQAADVYEVLQWVSRNAAERIFTLYLETTAAGEVGLLRLAGMDPTET
jgi:hypothetical protein